MALPSLGSREAPASLLSNQASAGTIWTGFHADSLTTHTVQVTAGEIQTYFKGIASDNYIYDPVNKKNMTDENREYYVEFESPSPGKMVYSINWITGRYLLRVYMFQKSRTVPSAEKSGKCELIHPR